MGGGPYAHPTTLLFLIHKEASHGPLVYKPYWLSLVVIFEELFGFLDVMTS